jgi:hypothetical protein
MVEPARGDKTVGGTHGRQCGIPEHTGRGFYFLGDIAADAGARRSVGNRRIESLSGPVPAHRRLVLLAEDNAVNQKLARHRLGRLGCEVDVASNGMRALDRWSQRPYDAIFKDCQMRGWTATRRHSASANEESAAGRFRLSPSPPARWWGIASGAWRLA